MYFFYYDLCHKYVFKGHIYITEIANICEMLYIITCSSVLAVVKQKVAIKINNSIISEIFYGDN